MFDFIDVEWNQVILYTILTILVYWWVGSLGTVIFWILLIWFMNSIE